MRSRRLKYFFNLFNRAQFGSPVEVRANARFGVVGSQSNLSRLVQVALNY
ncbi:MAG TPA: hypothetical protein VKB79_23505 [Bryobacteraceae bacterium]|nr:hypothetical protein [Bryobacteraceae bacterium]